MNAYTVEDYRAAAKRAMAAGDQTTAKSLIARGMALQAQAPAVASAADTSMGTAFKVGLIVPAGDGVPVGFNRGDI